MNTRAYILVWLVLCTAGCSSRTSRGLPSQQPDRVLFEKATTAAQQKRFAVANLSLQTLVNTYPESQYADAAKLMLQDPQIARCGENLSTAPHLCDAGAEDQ